MRVILRWAVRILLTLFLAALVVGFWKRDDIQRLWAVNTLFDEAHMAQNFSNMDKAFLTVPLDRGTGPVSELTYGTPIDLPTGADTWITDRKLTSLLVMKSGEIVYEDYFRDTQPTDRRISWSIAKSYLSALFGIVMAEGHIASLDDPVTKYAPLLRGTAYDKASVRNVLNMASGVLFNEDYFDYNSDINRMGRVVALGQNLDDFAASLTETFATPGERWQYVSIDTHVIGMVIRGATGRSVVDLLEEKIIQPLGQEADAYYITDGAQVAFVLGGLNITTRDYARFAQMIAQDGVWQGQQIVPADWIAASTRPSAPSDRSVLGYGYQWWIEPDAPDGEFYGRGIYGQFLYVDQNNDVVIIVTAADRNFRDPGMNRSNIEMMRRIADGL